jgi:hypothetical protein
VVENLEKTLVKDDTPLSSKYRILFSLRNIEGSKAHAAMLQGGSWGELWACGRWLEANVS